AVDRLMLLAIDYTGPLVDSEYLPILLEAVDGLQAKMTKHLRLAVSAFDGEGLTPFVGFDDADPKAGLAGLRKFRPRGRNVDLWGSFMGALDALEAAAAKSPLKHRQPILVIVTDRKDKVARHTVDEVRARVKSTAADVYVIGVGDGIAKEDLESLGKTGALFAAHPSEVDKPFDELNE